MSKTPIGEFLGIGCALRELASMHDEAERYGQGAILAALAERLDRFDIAVEAMETLAVDPDQAKWATERATEWGKRWKLQQGS